MMIDYTCKFCGRPGQVEAPALAGLNQTETQMHAMIEKWKKDITCPPCHSFYSRKLVLEDKIKEISLTIFQGRSAPEAEQDEVMPVLKTKLTNRLKEYGEMISIYLGAEVPTTASLWADILARPDCATTYCRRYFTNELKKRVIFKKAA